jgi:cbb3-type cytochrome oxidase subunit 3
MLVTGVERSVRRIRHIQNGAYVARSVLRAMALIVLATICFLAYVFFVFVPSAMDARDEAQGGNSFRGR